MSRFSTNMNTTCHTANTGAACFACASFVMMILAGIAMAMSVLFVSGLFMALAVLLCISIIGLIIILRLSGAKENRPKAMSMS